MTSGDADLREADARETGFQEIEGGCHCGAVRYAIAAPPRGHLLCYCSDCRRSAGAPVVGWATVEKGFLRVTGEVAVYNSTGDVERVFCPKCGTGLFYRSETLFPDSVDVQSGTFDDPEVLLPTEAIQVAEAPSWMPRSKDIPEHWRWPPGDVGG